MNVRKLLSKMQMKQHFRGICSPCRAVLS